MNDRGKSILIAESSENHVMYYSVLLHRMGFEVISAKNGVDTLRLVKLVSPDIILMGSLTVEMSDINLLKTLKEEEVTKDIPVIMLLEEEEEDQIFGYSSSGAIDCLVKPLSVKVLHRALEKVVKKTGGPERMFLRTLFNQKILLTCEGETRSIFAVSLSEGGMFVREKNSLAIGTDVVVTIPINDKLLNFNGNVVYVKSLYGDFIKISPGMGIRFRDLSDDDSRLLSSSILNILAADIVDEQEEAIISLNH